MIVDGTWAKLKTLQTHFSQRWFRLFQVVLITLLYVYFKEGCYLVTFCRWYWMRGYGPWAITPLPRCCGDLQPRWRFLEGRTSSSICTTLTAHQCLQRRSGGRQDLCVWVLQRSRYWKNIHIQWTKCVWEMFPSNCITLSASSPPLDRHDDITKDILELDPWDNRWTVVARRALMHDNYDVCLVANLNPRGLMSPPADLVKQWCSCHIRSEYVRENYPRKLIIYY